MKRYTARERERYEPHGCPVCGWRVYQDWLDATQLSDAEPMFVRGMWRCPNPGCRAVA